MNQLLFSLSDFLYCRKHKYYYFSLSVSSFIAENMIFLKFIVEGNIGCGKSSLISGINSRRKEIISAIYETSNLPVQIYCVKEPLHEWEMALTQYYSTFSNEDFLRLQLIIYTSLFAREKKLFEELQNSKERLAICFMERDMNSGENFFINNDLLPFQDSKILTEFSKILTSNSPFHMQGAKKYIFIESDPLTCFSRIATRQTLYDSKIPLAFLESLNYRYQSFFARTKNIPLSSHVLSNIHKTPPCVQDFIVPIILGALREIDNAPCTLKHS